MKLRLYCLFAAFSCAPASAQIEHRQGVVVSVSEPGSQAGLTLLQQGGSAVDAAVGTAFALAVTHPAAGNIGGGGFMVLHPPKAPPTVIDYRETAPAAATVHMFPKGHPQTGHRVVGVPGTVRGLALAHQKFGKLPWKDVLAPAIHLAEAGFLLDKHHAQSLNGIMKNSQNFAELQRVFGKPAGGDWQPGDRLKQPDLAKTLRLLAEHGPDAFYRGPIADLIALEMKRGGGLITKDDLQGYKAFERKPVHGVYRGYDLYAPPPPCSGGVCLMQMLAVLERFDLKKNPRFAPETLHLLIETMRRTYFDRARFLGDPAFTEIPDVIASKSNVDKWAKDIDRTKATPSESLAKDVSLTIEGDSTTHFSIIDKDGFAVANTYTLEQSYGSRVVVTGAGFLLNNEMLDFNWQPGKTTKAGQIGTPANIIAPGKRMLSSQTPTIVVKDGKVLLVTGSPGGRTIINTVLNIVINVIDYEMPIQEAVDAPRLHHQWFPDEVKFEGAEKYAASAESLRKLGHRVTAQRQGDGHSIWVNPRTGGYVGAADRRLSGSVAGY